MGGFGDIKSAIDKVKGTITGHTVGPKIGTPPFHIDLDKAYKTDTKSWFKTLPYGFSFTPKGDANSIVMFLPIGPNNLSISTHFATNAIPTLYGTVEEHSPVRYFDIAIAGTTGMAPKYVAPFYQSGTPPTSLGRDMFRVTIDILDVASSIGLFSKTINLIKQTASKATSLLDKQPTPVTGIFTNQTGYLAFHNLYKLLLWYKRDASGTDGNEGPIRKKHPLQFLNYKDGNRYDVVVRSFTLTRSAENPMLYMYNIQLRGYNLTDIEKGLPAEDIKVRLATLGLDGVNGSSVLGTMKGIANKVKGILGPLGGGMNTLGR
jgi:hypothetical protein